MKKAFTTILLISIHFSIYCQAWLEMLPQLKEKSSLTFYDHQNAFEQYCKNLKAENGYYTNDKGEKVRVPGYKQFKRWEYYMQGVIDPSTGAFPKENPFEIYSEYQRKQSKNRSATAADWKSIGPNSSAGGYAGIGRLNCIAFHPTDLNTYWVGAASGGLWVTYDDGNSWTCLTDNTGVLGISDIIIPLDYETSKTIYIATGDKNADANFSIGVLKTTNSGLSWNSTGLSFSLSATKMVNRLLIDPNNNNVLIAATSDGVFKTADGGITWGEKLTNINFVDMEYKPNDFTILYGSTRDGKIFKFHNGNFIQVFTDISNIAARIELAVTPAQPDLVYAVAARRVLDENDPQGSALRGIYLSVNSGSSFNFLYNSRNLLGRSPTGSEGSQGWYDLSLVVSPTNANNIFVGGINTWKSINGGTSWALSNIWTQYQNLNVPVVHADKHKLIFRNNGDLFECNDGGLYVSKDNGTTWIDKSNGLVISQMYKLGVSQIDEDETITGLQDNGTKLYGGEIWKDVIGGDGMECFIDYSDNKIQYGSTQYGDLYRTYDKWNNRVLIKPSGSGEGTWVTPFVIDPNSPDVIYAGYKYFYKSENKGTSWTSPNPNIWPKLIHYISISPSNSNTIYLAGLDRIWKTVDGGKNLSDVANNLPLTNANIMSVSVKHDDENTIWVTLGGYTNPGVYQSTNGGQSWMNISTGLPKLPAYTIVQNKLFPNEAHLYVGTELGVYFKKGNDEWVPYNSGLPNVKIGELEIYYDKNQTKNKLRAATYGRGLWESPIEIDEKNMSVYQVKVFQRDTANTFRELKDQEIIGIEIIMTGSKEKMILKSLRFTSEGSTNFSGDVSKVKVYSTGIKNYFNTDLQFGISTDPSSGEFIFEGYQELYIGSNFFWLVYDINENAVHENLLDARCLSVDISNEIIPTQNPNPTGHRQIKPRNYCSAGATSTDTRDEYISKVTFGEMVQESVRGNGGYQDFTDRTINIELGKRVDFQIGITNMNISYDKVYIWIDLNNDGDFNDIDEQVYDYKNWSRIQNVISGYFLINSPARIGNTRMRIRMFFGLNGKNETPCGNSDRGEVEDYSVNISFPTVPNNVTIEDSSCDDVDCTFNTGKIVAAVNNCPVGSVLEYSVNNGDWTHKTPLYNNKEIQEIMTRCIYRFGVSTSTSNRSVLVRTSPEICPPECECAGLKIIISGNTAVCEGQKTQITISGGKNYVWSNGINGNTANVGPGTYRVTVTDENSCTASTAITITSLPLPDVQIAGDLNICKNEETVLTVSGGLSYLWSTESQSNTITVAPVSSQNYTVTATDVNNCKASRSVMVEVHPLPVPVISGNTQSCEDRELTLISSEAVSYIWNTDATTRSISVAQSGMYQVTVTDENGCIGTSDLFDVAFFSPGNTPPPNVIVQNSTCNECNKIKGRITAPDFLCPAGYRLQYSTDGGINWSFDLPLYNELQQIVISTRCACTIDPSFGGPSSTISTLPELCPEECGCTGFTVDILGENAVCEHQTVILTASDGIEFLWSTGESTKSIIAGPGSYQLTVTDESQCIAEASILVETLFLPDVRINGSYEVCLGEFTLLVADGGVEYIWNTDDIGSSILVQAGIYEVTVTNQEGCTATLSVEVTELPPPIINITGKNNACIGEVVELTAEGGLEFLWSSGENTASISVVAGTYSVTVTDEKECSASTDYTVTELPSPVASVTGKSVVCTNELTEITAQGGTLFKWSNGAETAGIIVSDGLYSVTVTNEEGCTASVSKIVGKAPDVVPVIAGISALCEGEITQITATGGQTYIWSNGQTNASISVGPGEYTVTVSNEFSCTASATKNISGKPKPVAAIAGSTSICSGQTASLTASGGVSYLWSTGAQTPSVQVSPTVNTTYRVTVTASNQCTDTAELDIKVNSDPVIASSDLRFSAITRNQMTLNWTKGDGVNQLVVVKANGPVLSNPVNGASYNPSQTFGSGSTIGIGEFVVYYGTGNNVTVTNLIPGQTYYYKIFEQGCNLKYFAGSGTANTASQVTGCFTPSTQATNITTLSMHTQRLVVGWSNGSGSKRIVKINTVNQFTNLIDGTDPVANAQYSGQGEQVVYNGTGNSVTVTGLQPTSSYWFKVYEVACDGSFTKYNNQNATDNPKSLKTRIVVPSIQSLTATQGSSGGLPFYMNTEIYGNNPPIVIYADLSGQVRFRLNASISDKWSYQLDNKQGQKVSDGYTHLNEILYGKLSQPVSISHNIMESVYTLPEQINESPFLPLKLRLLFDNGLIGIDFPVHIFKALGASLPVTYLTFTALHNESDKTNDLFWTTSREVNSDYFDVERMVNDRNFEWIGKVESQGINADQHTDYVFTDQKLSENGLYIYRLRQTDLDGRWVYSPTASVYVSRISRFRTLIYPNPAHGRLTLQVSGDVGFSYGCEIYNSLGQLKHKIQTSQNDTGERHDELDISDWETGIYTVMLTLDGHRQVHKVIVVE